MLLQLSKAFKGTPSKALKGTQGLSLHQSFVKKVLNKLDISYNNLTLINLDNIFCSKSKQKCLIGNEKYSFYIDRNHLSKDGASLTRNKFIKMIEKF